MGVRPRAPLFAEEAAHTVSAPLRKPLRDAHDDLHAKKYAEAITKLMAAETIKGKAPYDQHLINDMLTFSYIKSNDFADAAKTMGAEIDDGFTPQSDIPQKVRGLAEINYQLKNYDKAIEYGRRAIKGGHGNETVENAVSQAYYLKGDWKGTREFEDELVTADTGGARAQGIFATTALQRLLQAPRQRVRGACS